eukprot:Platyproteum_vivax@DN4240_c0_g1_i1.p1
MHQMGALVFSLETFFVFVVGVILFFEWAILTTITVFHAYFPFPQFLDLVYSRFGYINKLFSFRLQGEATDEGLDMNVRQLLASCSKKLKCEDHFVMTPDQYELVMQRIVGNGTGPPVLFMHGLMMNSEIWVANEELSLPIHLHNEGYDVWMANNRGNKYSWKHSTLDRSQDKYWDFSIDEFANYDVPTCINYVIKHRKDPVKVAYIGFSNGSGQMFAALSSQPPLNDLVSIFIAIAPACKIYQLKKKLSLVDEPAPPPKSHHSRTHSANSRSESSSGGDFMSEMRYSRKWADQFQFLYPLVTGSRRIFFTIFGKKAILSTTDVWKRVLTRNMFINVVDLSLKHLFNWEIKNTTPKTKRRFICHLYSTTSVKVVAHWFQILRSGVFEHYGDSSTVGDVDVAPYDISRITCPVHIIYGLEDKLTDMRYVKKQLPSCDHRQYSAIPNYEHVDALVCADVPYQIFPKVLESLKKYHPITPRKSSVSAVAAVILSSLG